MARILVIDDEESIRSLLRRVLESAGYSVVEAHNGYAGLQCYWAEPADVVITDIEMPVLDGLQVITALRRAVPTAKIIAISGGSSMFDTISTLTPYVFEKPLQLGHLLAAVQALLSEGMPP